MGKTKSRIIATVGILVFMTTGCGKENTGRGEDDAKNPAGIEINSDAGTEGHTDEKTGDYNI